MDISTFYKDYLNATPQELAPHGYVLQDLVRRYPWFSLGHLLLFKALCGLGGDASLSQSEKTAAYVYSRQKLFFLLQQSREDFDKIAEEEFFTLDLSEAAADSALKKDADAVSERTAASVSERTAASVSERTAASVSERTADAVSERTAASVSERTADAVSERTAASASVSERTAASASVSERTAASVSERTAASASASERTAASASASKRTAASASASERTAASASASERTAGADSGKAVLSAAGPLEFVLDIPKDRTFYPGADYFGREQMAAVQLDVTAPIDRFISENPRFTQVLRRAGENVDTSEQDAPPALQDDEFVTETLAKIYALQGYHKLAIACYAKLILLYPEKSAYFASLVEEIKQKSNN
jgi:chemotaxis protein histidine kinase CheA